MIKIICITGMIFCGMALLSILQWGYYILQDLIKLYKDE